MLLLATHALQTPAEPLLTRKYRLGEQVSYRMTGYNHSPQKTKRYSAVATGEVGQTPEGKWSESIGWSDFVLDGKRFDLGDSGKAFRETLSLDPSYQPPFPDISKAPAIVGPITDLLTFYVDVRLAHMMKVLDKPGNHYYFKYRRPSSWADGQVVVLGQDTIDFDLTLKSVDRKKGVAELEVKHVPPATPTLTMPADWMKEPMYGTPNNWVQVEKRQGGSYVAGVGKETFDIKIKLSLANGSILSAVQDNTVDVSERVCADKELTNPGPPKRYRIVRRITIESLSNVNPDRHL